MELEKYTKITRDATKRYSQFIEALLLSTGLAFLMLGIAFGLTFLFKSGNPIEYPYILLIFALSFIIGSVFFEKKMANRQISLLYGSIASVFVTFILTTLFGGVKFVLNGRNLPEAEMILSSLAVCMVISMIIINLLAQE
ncbi:MAG: heat-shock protein [Halobacteriota archaeon]|nr:heat-shock protein [Halobacteriota archaeon]